MDTNKQTPTHTHSNTNTETKPPTLEKRFADLEAKANTLGIYIAQDPMSTRILMSMQSLEQLFNMDKA